MEHASLGNALDFDVQGGCTQLKRTQKKWKRAKKFNHCIYKICYIVYLDNIKNTGNCLLSKHLVLWDITKKI